MRVLIVGGGGREHAMVKKLLESPKIDELYVAPGNGGIGKDAVCVDIKPTDIPGMTAFAAEKRIGFVIVAPDDPLVLGMVDAMALHGIPCFGPNRAAARIEGSKIFSKNLMKRHGIPTAAYETFDHAEDAREYVLTADYPLWIKADGLALGKGAIQAVDPESAFRILNSLMIDKIFGESGSRVVVESHMSGTEVTVLAFTDGKTVRPMLSSMDYKRALDGDAGPNTGGMGAIAPNPYYTEEVAGRCMDEIFLPTVRAMESEGCPFKGCLYFGLMLTASGPKVVEYNCRFGDPETQVLLSLLDTDLLEIMLATANGTLADIAIRWKPGAAACVVMASGGYPGSYVTGQRISGLDEYGGIEGAAVFHAGTKWDGGFVTAGGRVLGVTAAAKSLESALEAAYLAAGRISFEGAHYRRDIGNIKLNAPGAKACP